jgi:uncharacterized protein (UPF0548 family)
VLLLRRPSDDYIKSTINAQRDATLTYDYVGWTERGAIPDGFAVNQWKTVIGNGDAAFQRAKDAMREYRMLILPWLRHVGPVEPLAPNSIVCTLVRQMGVYSLNVARIVYVDDQSPDRFGFGYGTLPEYSLVGEERFTVEFDAVSKNITFEIFSFLRPKSVSMSIARPLLRRAQRRFCIDSSTVMQTCCQS